MPKSTKAKKEPLEMHNPPHPGVVLFGLYIEPCGLTITEVAKQLGVDRKTISRIVNGRAPITVEMAMRLGKALGTSAKVWLGMQQAYDLWQARHSHKVDLSNVKKIRFNADMHRMSA